MEVVEWSAHLAMKRAFRVRRLLAPLSMKHILLQKKKEKVVNFLISILRGAELQAKGSVSQRHVAYLPEKTKKQADMVLPLSPRKGLGNNISMSNVYDKKDK